MSRVNILTPYSLDPIHPRTEMLRDVLREAGHEVQLIPVRRKRLDELVSRATFKMFNPIGTLRHLRRAIDCDVLLIQDMTLLLALPFAKLRDTRVVYETLDHCVDLRLHSQSVLRTTGLERLLRPLGQAAERALAAGADAVVVNSDSLHEYLGERARTLFYASPLEHLGVENAADRPPALLYLGFFSRDKGACEALDLSERLSIPLFVFGTIPESDVRERAIRAHNVSVVQRIASTDLRDALQALLSRHFLLGLSMIHPVHYSYAVQEANKDIDYLALGVPIIGNRRAPTAAKIEAGCGVFADDGARLEHVLHDAGERRALSARCREYYAARYARDIFARGLIDTVAGALG
jgi:glycosyltransferase involved in cell wall biosynthesis